MAGIRSSEYNLACVECLRQPLGRVAANAAQSSDREKCLFGKPASSALTGKVAGDEVGPAAPDLDVVGVRTQTEQLQRPCRCGGKTTESKPALG
jgi:hypothetical protein